MKTVLVTGGAGFIGINLVAKLLKDTDYEVINIDKLTYAAHFYHLNEFSANPRYHFYQLDILDQAQITEILIKYKPVAIMHLAAESHVDKSIEDPEAFLNTNIIGTYKLLTSASEYYKKCKTDFRFMHISTDEVFGSLGPSGHFDEQSNYNPKSPYSASKASSEMLVKAWANTYNIPYVITNCSNNYGPFQYHEKLIPLTIKNALSSKSISIYGDGKNIRDWLYVEDHCSALIKILQTTNIQNENFCIGTNNEFTNLEIVTYICDTLDILYPKQKNYKELITYVSDRPGHDFRYAIDSSKIKAALNWQALTQFQEGITKTIKWYIKHLNT